MKNCDYITYKSCTSLLEEKIIYICQNGYKYFLSLSNVIGIGLGYKYTCGIKTLKKCITVLVKKKLPINKLLKEDIIPKVYKGCITDVYETGNFKISIPQSINNIKEPVYANRIRPVLGGYSIGSIDENLSGTMTCLVSDGKEEYILTNAHVLCPLNRGLIGTPVVQPSLPDGGSYILDRIGYLKYFIPIKFATKESVPENFIDVALAKVTDSSIVSNKIAGIGKLPPIYHYIQIDDFIYKVGRTTGLTSGYITNIGCSMIIDYYGEKALFKNLIVANLYSDHGDSGAIIGRQFFYSPIGMLIAGNKGVFTQTIFTPIANVVDTLGVYIL